MKDKLIKKLIECKFDYELTYKKDMEEATEFHKIINKAIKHIKDIEIKASWGKLEGWKHDDISEIFTTPSIKE